MGWYDVKIIQPINQIEQVNNDVQIPCIETLNEITEKEQEEIKLIITINSKQ